MQHIFKKTLLVSALSLAIAPAAYATNGLAPTGLGQVHKAMGGAAVGNPQNTTTIMTNPAAASFVESGFDVGAEIFKPNRTAKNNMDFAAGDFELFTANPPGTTTAGTSYSGDKASAFLIPEAAYVRNNGSLAFGIAVYGNGGMNTSFEKSPAFAADANQNQAPDSVFNFNSTATGPVGTTGIDLKQIFISPTISKKINANHSVGLSINLVAQQFQAKGLSALSAGSSTPGKFTDQGKSNATGIGATLGWMGKINNKVTMGASYRFKTKMGKFKKYAGLFPDQGRMNVPAALTVGMSAKVSPKTTIAADIQQIYYSKTHAVGNSSQLAPGQRFGDTNGPGFGWEDQTVIKIGVKHQKSPRLALMAGYNHGDSPIGSEDTFFGVLTPAVVEDHLSLGFEYKLSKKSALVGSYTHTFSNEVKGNVALGQQFDISMDQDAVGIGYSRTF